MSGFHYYSNFLVVKYRETNWVVGETWEMLGSMTGVQSHRYFQIHRFLGCTLYVSLCVRVHIRMRVCFDFNNIHCFYQNFFAT